MVDAVRGLASVAGLAKQSGLSSAGEGEGRVEGVVVDKPLEHPIELCANGGPLLELAEVGRQGFALIPNPLPSEHCDHLSLDALQSQGTRNLGVLLELALHGLQKEEKSRRGAAVKVHNHLFHLLQEAHDLVVRASQHLAAMSELDFSEDCGALRGHARQYKGRRLKHRFVHRCRIVPHAQPPEGLELRGLHLQSGREELFAKDQTIVRQVLRRLRQALAREDG